MGTPTPTDAESPDVPVYEGGGPMSVDPVFEITDPDEPCDCGCGMAEGDR